MTWRAVPALLALPGAAGYLTVCLLSIGSTALALGLLLPRSVEATGIAIVFLVGSAMLDSARSLHAIVVLVPVRYWMRWTRLSSGGGDGLVPGAVAQAVAIRVALAAACAIPGRRDPAA